MSSPAGACEWCGGPQHWTIIRGDMYVSCDGGCVPLPLEGLVPPPDCEEVVAPEEKPNSTGGTSCKGEGSKPCEGVDADDCHKSGILIHVGVPLEAVLRSLWEGGPDGAQER